MTDLQKKLWTGIGIGFAAGGAICGATCYCVSKNIERRKSDERLRKMRSRVYSEGYDVGYHDGYGFGIQDSVDGDERAVKEAYEKGVNDATLEAQKWIDAHMIQVDSDDPAEIQKAIEAQQAKIAEFEAKSEKNDEKTVENIKSDDVYAEKGSISDPSTSNIASEAIIKHEFSGRRYMIQHFKSGTTLKYPYELFCDANGYLDSSQIRANLLEYEKDPKRLKLVWEAMGWGEYHSGEFSTVDTEPPEADEIFNHNYSISDEEIAQKFEEVKDVDEPMERTLEYERYLDELEKYRNNPVNNPEYITKQQFSDESHLEPIYVDYYALDNVFLDPHDGDKPVDATILFGVADGKELFEKNPYAEDDPDVVYMKNFGQNIVAEITRWNKSSSGLMDGSAYFDGNAGNGGGA